MAEVVYTVPSPHQSQMQLAPDAIRQSTLPHSPAAYPRRQPQYENPRNVGCIFQEHSEDTSSSSHSSDTSSPLQTPADYCIRSPLLSTPPSSISLDKVAEDDLYFPSYNDSDYDRSVKLAQPPPGSPIIEEQYDASRSRTESSAGTESSVDSVSLPPVSDDTAVRREPSRQVDYLSHEWREEDIWLSWRHIVSRRNVYGERSRLENASWRTWAKSKYHLKTVSPQTLNWLKDCDVTWLYGPLQEGQGYSRHGSSTCLKTKPGLSLNKKPILKKRTISEVMLQKSISSSSLVKQAAAAVQAQRNLNRDRNRAHGPIRPQPYRTQSDFAGLGTPIYPREQPELPSVLASSLTSGEESPEAGGRRHIRFDDKVEQCIAVEFESGGGPEYERPQWEKDSDDSSDEELVMSITPRRKPTAAKTQRSSSSQENKGIAMLPSTKLKYHHTEPECPGHPEPVFTPSWETSGGIHDSPSQETLRPSRPSSNFLIGATDDVDDEDISWEPSGAFARLRKDSLANPPLNSPAELTAAGGEGSQASGGLRRTASGMFMPFDQDEEDEPFATTGILGRVVDTVNTARDIAHVIWNVGWRK